MHYVSATYSVHHVLGTLLWDMTLWTQLLFSHNSEETESLQYVSRFLRQDSLIFTQNLADVSHVQYLLLKCPNPAPWDKPMIFTTLSHYLIKT
jgi:hypothetical protein